MGSLTSWTDAEDAILRKMAERGASARIIAETLSRSRNAVIGRSHRIKVRLSPRIPGPAKHAKPKAPKVVRKAPPKAAPPPAPALPSKPTPISTEHWKFTPAPVGVTFMTRGPFQCAFMLDKGYLSPVCARPIAHENTPYCAEHHALTHAPVTGPIKGPSDPATRKAKVQKEAEDVGELIFDAPEKERESSIFFAP